MSNLILRKFALEHPYYSTLSRFNTLGIGRIFCVPSILLIFFHRHCYRQDGHTRQNFGVAAYIVPAVDQFSTTLAAAFQVVVPDLLSQELRLVARPGIHNSVPWISSVDVEAVKPPHVTILFEIGTGKGGVADAGRINRAPGRPLIVWDCQLTPHQFNIFSLPYPFVVFHPISTSIFKTILYVSLLIIVSA